MGKSFFISAIITLLVLGFILYIGYVVLRDMDTEMIKYCEAKNISPCYFNATSASWIFGGAKENSTYGAAG